MSELYDIGHAVRPIAGQAACGDAALAVPSAGGALVALVDGLGHGAAAAQAAAACTAIIAENADLPLPAIFAIAHERLRGGRGAVAAIARFHAARREAEVAGLGNVAIVIAPHASAAPSTAAVSVPGVLGGAFRRVRSQRLPFAPGDLLVLHTDGVRGPIDTLAPRLLRARDAAADLLASRGAPDDDAGCVIVRALTAPEIAALPAPSGGAAELGAVQLRVPLRCEGDAQIAAFEARRLGARIGLGDRAQWEVGIAAAELATNAQKHGIEGVLLLRHARDPEEALVLEVVDRGEGITPGARGGGASVRRAGEGLGVGLGSVHRLMDQVEVCSVPSRGTRIVARKRVIR